MWPEVDRARSENRHELVLGGREVAQRVAKDGVDPAIFTLTSLNYLDIHEVGLQNISDDISNLTSLQSLVLHSNKLTDINCNVYKLLKLKLLDLSHNQLKEVPEDVNNLINIVTLNFCYNSLEDFPKLMKTSKLTVLNLSNNKLKTFPDVCYEENCNLSEIKLSDNEIDILPPSINKLPSLKVLELSGNKIKTLPGELVDCTKLKVIDLKKNPISDRRLLKLIDQCRTKQIIDYVKAHSPRTVVEKNDTKDSKMEEIPTPEYKHSLFVHYGGDKPNIVVFEGVKKVRPYLAACLIHGINFNETTFKKFIQVQNKLHEGVCGRRTNSTIATHDFSKLPPGNLRYTAVPPNDLIIVPLNRSTPSTGTELFTRLQVEAHNLRKERKRNTYSGIHKYLYLIEGHPNYPCLLNSEETVISFPPITNCDQTKISPDTKSILVEVTSSTSLHMCKTAAEALIKEMVNLFEEDLHITQLKTVDEEGTVHVTFPSKADLNFEDVRVVRD